MDETVARQLIELNRRFYEVVAAPFARSRAAPQPGFLRLLPFVPEAPHLLDVGCGEGRFGRLVAQHRPGLRYMGVDFTPALLSGAADSVPGEFHHRELHEPGFLAGQPRFEVIACLATLQHLPGRARRERFLAELVAHLRPGGRLMLSTWQFMSSERQRRKLRPWSEVGIDPKTLEPGDHLLSWDRGQAALRYVAMLETDWLQAVADQLQCTILSKFRADGREGDLNLYVVWQK